MTATLGCLREGSSDISAVSGVIYSDIGHEIPEFTCRAGFLSGLAFCERKMHRNFEHCSIHMPRAAGPQPPGRDFTLAFVLPSRDETFHEHPPRSIYVPCKCSTLESMFSCQTRQDVIPDQSLSLEMHPITNYFLPRSSSAYWRSFLVLSSFLHGLVSMQQ
jgi:hypothetical protein